MSRNTNIVGRIIDDPENPNIFRTLFFSKDGLNLLEIVRKVDPTSGNVVFTFVVDGIESSYYTKTEIDSEIDKKISSLGNVLRYVGSVAIVSELPVSGNTVGDVYAVTSTGSEYVYVQKTGQQGSWEELGPIIDLNGYYTKSEIDAMIGDINSVLDNINGEVV